MAGGGIGAAVLDSQALLIHSDDLFHHYVTVVVLKFETERERERVCVYVSLCGPDSEDRDLLPRQTVCKLDRPP